MGVLFGLIPLFTVCVTHSNAESQSQQLEFPLYLILLPLIPLRYDEEQAQSENAERELRSRSGQSLGSKGGKGSAGVRPAAATWK